MPKVNTNVPFERKKMVPYEKYLKMTEIAEYWYDASKKICAKNVQLHNHNMNLVKENNFYIKKNFDLLEGTVLKKKSCEGYEKV